MRERVRLGGGAVHRGVSCTGGPLQGMRSMSLEERLLSTDALFFQNPGIVQG